MANSNEPPGQNHPGGLSRRMLLGAVGTGVGLAGLSKSAGAFPVDVDLLDGASDTEEPLTALELADARVDRYGLGRISDKTGCFKPENRELYGPTDVNAQSANGRLAVGINREGTITVFRWPRPSFYDQVKYFTRGRDDNADIVVTPNHGAFLGIAADTGDGYETTWLRDWADTSQRYANDTDDVEEDSVEYSVAIFTDYTNDSLGLEVTVRDVVPDDCDAFIREIQVIRNGDSDVESARLVSFANLGLVTEKVPQYPVQDWCLEEDNHHRARYLADEDVIVHDTAGVDVSTGEPQSVAIGMGFDTDSAGYQVGGDAHDPAAEPTADAGPTRDAYDDAATGTLSGNDQYIGQATSALSTALNFDPGEGGKDTVTLYFSAGESTADVTGSLETLRNSQFSDFKDSKEEWLHTKLEDAPLPDETEIKANEDEETADVIMSTVRRALVCLVTNFDRESGAIVASITTQPPYGEDWPRDGAFFNFALEVIGQSDWVAKRNRWYADIQQQTVDSVSNIDVSSAVSSPQLTSVNTPPANWNMCYYGDGVAGGPIPFQIDTTGWVVWTLWDHYEVTGDDAYLADVYPAIQRAADFLVQCRDPTNDLQCPAFEDDRFTEPTRQTINGAIPVWKALQSAANAAEALGHSADATRYRERQHELGQAIDRELYDDTNGAYGTAQAGFAYGETVWPAAFTPYVPLDTDGSPTGDISPEPADVEDPLAHPRIQDHLETDASGLEVTFDEPDAANRDTGQYEAKTLITLAKAVNYGVDDRELVTADFVRRGVRWLATEHATDDTHIMGESWRVFPDEDDNREVRSIIGQPHIWEQILLYLTALETYPPDTVNGEAGGEDIGGVLKELRSG